MHEKVEIIVGTYEEFLLGYRLDTKNELPVLTQSFADKSHSGAVKCLAVHGRWVATGSTDDRIFIYDMRSRKQSQIILSHDGTINALAFTPDSTHLLSAGDDGHMIATRLNTWFAEANWKKAHSGNAVTHISCHPSGKLALSLGADLVLRTWNLVKGRVAYKTNLKTRNTLGSMPDCLAWSTTGNYFTLSGQRVVEIWSIKTADVVRSQKTTSKPVSISWVGEETCLVGLEDGKVLWVSVKENEKETVVEAHNARVKAMAFYKGVLVTTSSTGEIKLWEVNENRKTLKKIAATNTGCRPTCIGILDVEQFGSDYIIGSAIAEKPMKSSKTPKKSKQLERCVVTIEYENDEEVKEAGNGDESEQNQSVNEESSEQESADEDDGDSISEVSSDENGECDAAPSLRLPKSRKRKQQLLEEHRKKQAKLSEKVKQQKKKQSSKEKTNLAAKKNKQELKK